MLVPLLTVAMFGLTVVATTASASSVDAVRADLATATAKAPSTHALPIYALVRAGSSISVLRGRSSDADFASLRTQLHALAGVLAVGVDAPVHAVGTLSAQQAATNDPLYSQQWALQAVDYQDVWPTTNGTGTLVAVLDTGTLATHEDLSGNVNRGAECVAAATESACTTPANAGETDPFGHGTHVSGILAAHANNDVGVAGAAPGVHLLPVRVLDSTGGGTTEAVAAGILWATDHGASVISMSLAGSQDDAGIDSAIDYAVAHNVVVVAASGNNGAGGAVQWPANYHNTISVGAIQDKNSKGAYTVASFSNTTSNVALLAPGDSIESTYNQSNSSYAVESGTSMATPYVSAAFALLHSAQPTATRAALVSALESTAVPVAGSSGLDTAGGFGIVNPLAALNSLHTTATSTTKATTTTTTKATTTTRATTTTTRPTTTTTRPTTTTTAPKPAPLAQPPVVHGYWVATFDGTVRPFGVAWHGDRRGKGGAPIVALGATPDGRGYWLVGADGSVFPFGDARSYGSFAGHHLNAPIVAMAPTQDGKGYWLLGRDGGIFSFGDAHFYGSTGNLRLNKPIVDIAASPGGKGYWLVGSDGGIFSFGDAHFHGSTGNLRLAAPVVSMAASPSGKGYWLIARDGGVFSFGVPFFGSLPGRHVRSTVVRLRVTPTGGGYWMLAANGAVYTFGNAPYKGSAAVFGAVDIAEG